MSKYETTIDATGSNGNVFAIIGTATRHLKQLEGAEAAKAFSDKCMSSEGYAEVLELVQEYFPVHT